nr:hypothetical protein BaRGS_007669 [Batillaria attramentaria]
MSALTTALLTALLLAYAQCDPTAPSPCSAIQQQYSADDKDCKVYHICNHGSWVEMPCGAGTYFNDALDVCDWPANIPNCDANGNYIGGTQPTGHRVFLHVRQWLHGIPVPDTDDNDKDGNDNDNGDNGDNDEDDNDSNDNDDNGKMIMTTTTTTTTMMMMMTTTTTISTTYVNGRDDNDKDGNDNDNGYTGTQCQIGQ